ncbi:MAG: class IV adenylate cyclase [Candidatus Daviesbacteria bacterium]|nr:class IV adenylate cyclase [Candidatus Daviesbacteria bacterium]
MKKIGNKTIEVEIRALVNDAKSAKLCIGRSGAKFIRKIYVHDIYFCNKNYFQFADVEMNSVGSYSLRLRCSRENQKQSLSLNTKIITKESDHNAWEEHESEVSNFSEVFEMLCFTEFKPFFELKKWRLEYKFNNLNIFIEEIEDFGSGIEVEIMTIPGCEEKAKKQIMEFLNSIGISSKDIVPKSVTNIIMRKRAFKNEIIIDKNLDIPVDAL